MAHTPPETDSKFNEFYTEVKEIEKRDSVLTPKQQIDRLLRPGSTYFNLNPFEVLQVEPETTIEDIKKQYRRLSFLVHPDKNQNDADRAQQAFEAVNKAWKTLESDETRKKCLDIIEEAKGRTDLMVSIFAKFVVQLARL
jgi:DnaJ family protein C protein 8